MKKGLVFIFLVIALPLSQAQVSFVEWLDDDHFLLRKNGVTLTQNALTGEEKPFTAPPKTPAANQFSSDQNPTFSPDQTKIAFTRSGNLFIMDVATKSETQLTFDGSDLILNGYASWVYFEEILGRASRYRAFYWSPDSKKIAFLRFDDNLVPEYSIFHDEAEDMTHGYLEKTRYPKSGDPLPGVELKTVDISTGQITAIQKDQDLEYLAMIKWTPDGTSLCFQQLNRDQNHLKIFLANPQNGTINQVYEEKQKAWIDWFEDLYLFSNSNGAILRSNHSGWSNLYHIDFQSAQTKPITQLNWRVTGLEKVDEENKTIYFTGTDEDPTDSYLYKIDFDGTDLTKITNQKGSHRSYISPSKKYIASSFNNYTNPGEILLLDENGQVIRSIHKETKDPNVDAGIKVEMMTITTSDGLTLPAHWVLPPNFDPGKKYPVIFTIYGGPDAGTVFNRYRDYSKNNLVNAGIILFTVDHRSSGKLGKKGLDYMHRNLGKWEMHDYFEAVEWLRKKPFIDPERIGITGGSYGGYMTAMALTYGAEYFTHGVSSAPVTDWRLYDNAYTERFMDTPRDNPEGYQFGSVMTHANKLKGKLLLIHGTIDDNVHMQHTMQLISKLQDEGKSFELMLYPGARHGWGGAKKEHSNAMSEAFWMKHFFNQ